MLKPIASRVLMKILYCARMCRYDLLRATCALACRVTKWTKTCDRRLHRLVCYILHSLDRKMIGWIADPVEDLTLALYSDADFAGDPDSMKSTSGVFLALIGPSSFVPLGAVSKKQTCVSHSTPEAELVAADLAVRAEGLPALTLWEVVWRSYAGVEPGDKSNMPEKLRFREDNAAAIQILKSGKSPTLRHLG